MSTRRITTALAAFALVGALGACGGDDDEATGDPTTGEDDSPSSEGTDPADAALEYAQCMRDHGVNMEDPEVGSDGEMSINLDGDTAGATDEELQAAEDECKPILDEAQPDRDPISPEELAERQDQAVQMAQCMRDRGWDMPDPEVEEGGGIAVQNPPNVGGPGDPNFEKFEDDMRACEDEAGMERPEGEGTLTDSEEPPA